MMIETGENNGGEAVAESGRDYAQACIVSMREMRARAKITLGELDPEIALEEMRKLYESTLAEAVKWCREQQFPAVVRYCNG